MEHSPGDLETSGHPARVRRHEIFTSVRERHQLEHPRDPRLNLSVGDAVEHGVEPQVFLGRELIVEGLLLEDEPDVAADRLRPGGHIEAGDGGVS